MNFLVLTQSTGRIIGPVARLLGVLMNGLFNVLSAIGLPNIGLAIILFTIIVNIILLPLTYKQQKGMKITAIVNPEIQKINAKYKGKKDQDSMMKQQAETKEIYNRYGYSPTSGCLPVFIQLPILWALYRVIYQIPGYVTSIKEQFQGIVDLAVNQNGFASKIGEFAETYKMTGDKYDLSGTTTESMNQIIDLFYKFTDNDWATFKSSFPAIADQITPYVSNIRKMNSFIFGINMAEAPGFKLTIALIIPILAFLSQWISMRITTKMNGTGSGDPNDPTSATMKSMNTFMPIFSAYLCISFPAGIGVYWIASAVVRTIIQVILNNHFDKIGSDKIIDEAIAKQNKKRVKEGIPEINKDGSYVHNKNKNSASTTAVEAPAKKMPDFKKNVSDSSAYYDANKTYEKGSISARARMVQDLNNKEKKN